MVGTVIDVQKIKIVLALDQFGVILQFSRNRRLKCIYNKQADRCDFLHNLQQLAAFRL